MLIYIVVLLDPRYKKQYIQFVLELRYGERKSLEKLKIVKEVASTWSNDYNSRYGSQSKQLGELSQFSSNV